MNTKNLERVTPDESQGITKEKLKKFLPKGSSANVTDEVMELISNMERDTGLPQNLLEEDLMSYLHLLGKGTGVKDLINAIKFCNLKRNMTNREAWAIVFPSKFDELNAEGRQVDSHVSMYNNSKLVVAIDKEMLVPTYIQYSSYHHAAIKKQYQLMNGDDGHGGNVSAMVMHLAAKELAAITKMPEEKSIELKIGMSDAALSAQQEMNNSLAAIVANQAKMFASGMHPAEIQKIHSQQIIEEAQLVSEEESE